MNKKGFWGLFVLSPQRLFECYPLESDDDIIKALLIYDHFFHDLPPGMKEEPNRELRRHVAALALQRVQEKGDAISEQEIGLIRSHLTQV